MGLCELVAPEFAAYVRNKGTCIFTVDVPIQHRCDYGTPGTGPNVWNPKPYERHDM